MHEFSRNKITTFAICVVELEIIREAEDDGEVGEWRVEKWTGYTL